MLTSGLDRIARYPIGCAELLLTVILLDASCPCLRWLPPALVGCQTTHAIWHNAILPRLYAAHPFSTNTVCVAHAQIAACLRAGAPHSPAICPPDVLRQERHTLCQYACANSYSVATDKAAEHRKVCRASLGLSLPLLAAAVGAAGELARRRPTRTESRLIASCDDRI